MKRGARTAAALGAALAWFPAALHAAAENTPAAPAPEIVIRSIAAVHVVAPPEPPAYHPVFGEARLRRELAPLVGRGCDPAAIVERLALPYRALGYVPEIEASCEDGALRVSIRESSHRIALITFDASDLSRIGVSPDREFEDKRRLYPVPAQGPRALLRGLLETREGDLYNAERYRSEREAMARLGYTIAFVPGVVSGEAAYPQGAYLIVGLTPARKDEAYTQRETNYLGGTGSYAPRSGSTAGILYQKDEVFGRLDQLTVTPTYNSSLGGTVVYRAPILAAREEPRRLYDIQGEFYSNFTHNRSLDGVTTDQRRSGLGVTLGIRPLALPAPNILRLEVGLRHERVNLGEPLPGQDDENLTILRLGATHEWRHTFRWPSLAARLEPAVDLSFDRAGGERSFVRPALDASLHSRSRSGLETDLHFIGGTLDRQVPAFELWSLGGPTTVRGFREDTFLGRHLAALQAELWLPFVRASPPPLPPADGEVDPGEVSKSAPRFEPRAGRLIRGAIFLDGGTISGVEGSGTESLFGAGVGVRFIVPHQPLVFRIDYGWGLGARGGHSYPYISLAYRF
jgi:outer membrane protein assembly factor BamA